MRLREQAPRVARPLPANAQRHWLPVRSGSAVLPIRRVCQVSCVRAQRLQQFRRRYRPEIPRELCSEVPPVNFGEDGKAWETFSRWDYELVKQ